MLEENVLPVETAVAAQTDGTGGASPSPTAGTEAVSRARERAVGSLESVVGSWSAAPVGGQAEAESEKAAGNEAGGASTARERAVGSPESAVGSWSAEDGGAEGTEAEAAEAAEPETREAAAARVTEGWLKEEQELKSLYPSFDLRAECRNASTGERFKSLLQAGLDIRTAYEAVHRDAILRGAMQYAARRIRDGALAGIRLGQDRPRENGLGGQGAAGPAKLDVRSMTRAQREQLARRVMHGERVEL